MRFKIGKLCVHWTGWRLSSWELDTRSWPPALFLGPLSLFWYR